MSFGLSKFFRRWYLTAGNVLSTRFARVARAGFQHCSMGLSSGVYVGKCSNRRVWRCRRQNSRTCSPLWAGPLSTKRSNRRHRRSACLRNWMNSRCRLRLLNLYANARLVRAPNTFVQTFLWLMRISGLLSRRAHSRATIRIKPKVASSCAATTKPRCLYVRTNRRVFF